MSKNDEMGRTAEELLRWMVEVAEARDTDPRARTVNLKFSANTLRMWRDRVRDVLAPIDSNDEFPFYPCENDPDGLHSVGCGCSF